MAVGSDGKRGKRARANPCRDQPADVLSWRAVTFSRMRAIHDAIQWNYNVPMAVLAKIVRIGNSRGLRIPKALLDEASLTNEVELRAEPGKLTVSAVRTPRAGWADVAREARAAGDDRLLDPPFRNDFDENDWRW